MYLLLVYDLNTLNTPILFLRSIETIRNLKTSKIQTSPLANSLDLPLKEALTWTQTEK